MNKQKYQGRQSIMDFSCCSESVTAIKEHVIHRSAQSIYIINHLEERKRKKLLNYIINHEKSF